MKAILLVGGLGTRMRPLTLTTPKPILPIWNKPFLLYQLEHLQQHGVTEVILCMQYLSEEIERVVSESGLDINVHFIKEDEPLGTGGAIKNVEQFFDSDPVLVGNGDILTDLNISEMVKHHLQHTADVSIATREVEDPCAFGLVISNEENQISEFFEKPETIAIAKAKTEKFFINSGTYIINPGVFDNVPAGKKVSIERETFPGLLSEGKVLVSYPSDAYWLDLGTPIKYLQAHKDIHQNKGNPQWGSSELSATHDMQSAKIKGFSSIGKGFQCGSNCIIEDSVILNNVTIGDNIKIESAIIGNNCKIHSNISLKKGSILGDNETIKA